MEIFVGKKSNPTFLVVFESKIKQITIYRPDHFSENEEFYEKYSLGKVVLKKKYDKIYLPPITFCKSHCFIPTLIFKTNYRNILVSTKIYKN